MTGDYLEKYVRINTDWVGKAGKLASVLASQKRIVTRMSKSKQTEDTKELLLSVAASIDATEDLLTYAHKLIEGVVSDSRALVEGSNIRNIAQWQGEFIGEILDNKHRKLDELAADIRANMAKRNGTTGTN